MFITLLTLVLVVSFLVGLNGIKVAQLYLIHLFESDIHVDECHMWEEECTKLENHAQRVWKELLGYEYSDFQTEEIRICKNGAKLMVEKDAVLGRRARFISNEEYAKIMSTENKEECFVIDITDITTGKTVRKSFEVEMPDKVNEAFWQEKRKAYYSGCQVMMS